MIYKRHLLVVLCVFGFLSDLHADDPYNHVSYLLGIADSLAKQNNYEEALDTIIVAGEDLKLIQGGVGRDYTDYVAYPASLYLYQLSKISDAKELLNNTITFRQQYYPHDCTMADMYSFYSVLCRESGDYYKALLTAQNGITIARKQENCHKTLVASLGAAAQACVEMGDYEDAIQYTEEIINQFPTDTGIVLTAMNNLSSDYIELGNYDKAIQIAEEAIKLKDDNKEHQASLLFQLALAYSYKGDYHKAINYDLQSLSLKERLSTPSESIAKSFSNLGDDYLDFNMPDSALYYYDKAMDIILERDSFVQIEKMPSYLDIESKRINLFNEFGLIERLEKSIYDFDNGVYKWLPHYKDRLFDTWKEMDVNRIQQLKQSVRTNCFRIINQNKNSRSDIANQNGYDACLLYFESARNMIAEKMKAVRRLDNDTLYELYIKQLYWDRILLSNHRNEYTKEQIDTIKMSINYCNNQIGIYLETIDIAENLRMGWKDIQQALDSNELAVEFFRSSTDSLEEYHAYLLRKTWNAPKCVIIKSKDQLSESDVFGQNIWKTIIDSASVNKGDRIYFSPSGEMYQTPFETTLYNDSVCYNEIYDIVRVSSTRILCHRHIKLKGNNWAYIYGGLIYTKGVKPISKKSQRTKNDLRQFFFIPGDTSINCRDIDRAQFAYLPYSKKEANAVHALLKEAKYKTKLYSETKGTEESIYSMHGASPAIIHIATHGIYVDLTSNDSINTNPSTKHSLSKRELLENNNSMGHTGLLLSGALTLNKTTADELANGLVSPNGILSANEIGYLDLTQTDLVVLSCCNTGLGKLTNDGVAGLQRGFKMAGVNSIMMSLWSVDDAATYLLMTEFYKNYLGGKTKNQSLREAQRYLRNYEQDGEKIFADPKYWAAFVLLDALD